MQRLDTLVSRQKRFIAIHILFLLVVLAFVTFAALGVHAELRRSVSEQRDTGVLVSRSPAPVALPGT